MRRSLVETNPYLANPERREQMLVRNAIDSSAIEGARGLRTPRYRSNSDTARRRASAKKSESES